MQDAKIVINKPTLRNPDDEVVIPTPIEPDQLFTQKSSEEINNQS